MTYRTSDEFGQRLCRVLGVDPDRYNAMTITFVAGSLPEVVLTRLVDGDEIGAILEIFESYQLNPELREP